MHMRCTWTPTRRGRHRMDGAVVDRGGGLGEEAVLLGGRAVVRCGAAMVAWRRKKNSAVEDVKIA
jgi:hypothetical protein